MSLVKSIGKQKVNLDFNKDFINLFTQKIKQKDIQFINLINNTYRYLFIIKKKPAEKQAFI